MFESVNLLVRPFAHHNTAPDCCALLRGKKMFFFDLSLCCPPAPAATVEESELWCHQDPSPAEAPATTKVSFSHQPKGCQIHSYIPASGYRFSPGAIVDSVPPSSQAYLFSGCCWRSFSAEGGCPPPKLETRASLSQLPSVARTAKKNTRVCSSASAEVAEPLIFPSFCLLRCRPRPRLLWSR